jgi:hypothetical protein
MSHYIPCQSCLDTTAFHLQIYNGIQHRLQVKIGQKYFLVNRRNLPYSYKIETLAEIASLEKQFEDNEAGSPERNISLCSRHSPP